MLSISMNYFIARSPAHETCCSFNGGMYLFAHHQFSFALAAFAATEQLHHPKRDDYICFDTQLHQGSEIPPPHSDPVGVSMECP